MTNIDLLKTQLDDFLKLIQADDVDIDQKGCVFWWTVLNVIARAGHTVPIPCVRTAPLKAQLIFYSISYVIEITNMYWCTVLKTEEDGSLSCVEVIDYTDWPSLAKYFEKRDE